MAITAGDGGYQQTPDSPTNFTAFFDAAGEQPAHGFLIWCETANCEIYFDTIGGSSEVLTIVAGAEPVPFVDAVSGFRNAYVRGGGTAQFSWVLNYR